MYLELTQEQIMLRDSVRRFARQGLVDLRTDLSDTRTTSSRIRDALDQLGLWSLTVPVEKGGSGFDLVSACIATEELACHERGTALAFALHVGAVSEALCRLSDTEVSVGSAPTGLLWPKNSPEDGKAALRAYRTGQQWKVEGTATGLLPADGDGRYLVLCPEGDQTTALRGCLVDDGPSRGENRLGLVGPRRIDTSVELTASSSQVVRFESTRDLHLSKLLAALGLGVAQKSLVEAIEYAGQRRQFGRTIDGFQAIRFKLADMATGLERARWALWRSTASGDEELVDLALLSSVETALFAADEALQIHGGYGYTEEYPIEGLYRDSRELSSLVNDWRSFARGGAT